VKVIQVPFCFYPDPIGGTEVYVEALSRQLQALAVDVAIAAPSNTHQTYDYHQLPVKRFATGPIHDLKDLHGAGDVEAAMAFSQILEQEQPDLVHLHAFTRGASLRLVQAAKQRDIPVVFTYHTPTVSCFRGTLLQAGHQVCDGQVDVHRCSRCILQGLGLESMSAYAVGSLPPFIGRSVGSLQLQGGLWTALRTTEMVSERHQAFHTLMGAVDHVIAVCNWVKDVLRVNQVPAEKITVIRQGLCHTVPSHLPPHPGGTRHSVLKLAFLGRLDPTKGLHVLLQAIRAHPDLNVSLDIYGISQSPGPYDRELQTLAANDPRIQFCAPLAADAVIPTLAHYDLLAVPSQWLETGPMVILEAFAAGTPIIGSNLGGIAELVQPNVNGILVEPASISDWSYQLQQLSYNPEHLRRLREGVSPPAQMDTVAEQMVSIYHQVINTNVKHCAI
jgi:glycosyltransferase involved in cell wall biosynthesis